MDQTWQPYNLETYSGGVSSAVSPDLLPPNQTAWGMNVDFRGTKIHTRPNIHQRMYLPSGLVQGVGYFNIQGGMLVAVIAGIPYRVRIGIRNGDFSYEPIVLPFYNSPIIKQVWMCQTVESFIIQDGQSDAIIYDGSTARRADRLKTEVPIGLQMAYGNGRLWVAIEGNQLVAGDIRTADAGTELLFTENQYLSGGGALIFPDTLTGLSFIPVTGTSDYGALVAFGRNYVDTVRADITQRDSWASYPGFVTNAMRNVGTPSGRTIVQVNQDLMWRDALGGLRSLNTSLSNAYYAQYRGAQSDANVPISREVSRLVEFDSQQLLGFSSGVYFDNRLLMTSSPFLNVQGGVSHRDLVSLDFAPVSTMQGQSPPAYNGTWQGVDWTQLVKGEFNGQTRAFGISSDQDGFNRLWEFDSGQVDDVYISNVLAMTDGTASLVALSPIECFVEYPRIDFGEPKRRKRITRCDVWMSNLTGNVDLQVYWRPDNNQKWTLWDETSHCAIMQDAATTTPHVWKNLLPEQRPLVKSFSIPDTFDDMTTYALATGFGFQIRLAWTGSVRIERVALWAQAVDGTDYVEREGQEPTCITNDVTGNEIRYEIPLGRELFPDIQFNARVRSGEVSLCGFSEFGTPSVPPRAYKRNTISVDFSFCVFSTSSGCSGASAIQRTRIVASGTASYDGPCNLTQIPSHRWNDNPGGAICAIPTTAQPDVPISSSIGDPNIFIIGSETTTSRVWVSRPGCYEFSPGTSVSSITIANSDSLSSEDTEIDAISRFQSANPWGGYSPCVSPSSCCKAAYEQRVSSLSFFYQEAEYDILFSNLGTVIEQYRISLDVYRRIYGGSTYALFETLVYNLYSDPSGQIEILGLVPNLEGYETFVSNPQISPL